jgi:MFS family permease
MSPARAWFLLAALMLAYMFAFVDRVMLGLLVGPISRDLGIGDTEFSLLAGFAFALLYTLLGLPIGIIIDRQRRLPVVVVGSLVWTLATAACGLAASFGQLFIGRMAVGIGEATLSPASASLLADAFAPSRRGLAMSLYACGITIGGGLALVGGGFLVEAAEAAGPTVLPIIGALAGWQLAFIVTAAAGLIVPILLAFAHEPDRPQSTSVSPPALPWLAKNWRTIVPVFAGYSLMVIVSYALVLWVPAALSRIHGLAPSDIGLVVGLSLIGPGTLGMICGGLLSDKLVRAGRSDGPIIVSLASMVLQLPLFASAMLVTHTPSAIALLAAATFAISMIGGLQIATVQALTPPPLHGRITALYLLVANVVGLGIGPTLIAATSDTLGGPQQIGRALALVGSGSLLAAVTLTASALRRNRHSRAAH